MVAATAPPPAATIADACGAGFRQYPALLANAVLRENADYSDAATVAALAPQFLADGDNVAPLHSEPLYVRHKVAQTTAQRQAAKAAQSSAL